MKTKTMITLHLKPSINRSPLRLGLLLIPLVLGCFALSPTAAAAGMPGPSQFYAQHNIVSDVPGLADHTDANVVNAWGLDSGPTSPWWISDNGTGESTLYNVGTDAIPATFTVPGAGGAQGNPPGLIFNGGNAVAVNNGRATSAGAVI